MASYVAHYTKKKERLHAREDKLLRSIRSGAPSESQLRLAEDVRQARIRAFRAERATFEPTSSGHTDRFELLGARMASLEAMTAKEILIRFIARVTASRHE